MEQPGIPLPYCSNLHEIRYPTLEQPGRNTVEHGGSMDNTATSIGEKWISKQEAAELLEVSTKTVQKYVTQGKLSCRYERTKNGDAMFLPESEVMKLREQHQQAIHRPTVEPPGLPAVINQLMPHQDDRQQLTRFMGSLELFFNKQHSQVQANTLTLSVKEAALLTGLTQKFILEAITRGDLIPIQDGNRKRLRRKQVEQWIDQL
jgi:excisionase family DNA binding protein